MKVDVCNYSQLYSERKSVQKVFIMPNVCVLCSSSLSDSVPYSPMGFAMIRLSKCPLDRMSPFFKVGHALDKLQFGFMSYYPTPIKLSLNASDSFRLANIRDLVEFKDHRKNVKTEEKTYYCSKYFERKIPNIVFASLFSKNPDLDTVQISVS